MVRKIGEAKPRALRMSQCDKQFPILPLQPSPGHELHIDAMCGCEEFAGIGDLFSFHLEKLA
jgi:hypothetical protein